MSTDVHMNWQDSTEWVLPPGSDQVEDAVHILRPGEEEDALARFTADEHAGLPLFSGVQQTPDDDLLSGVSMDAEAGACGNGAFCA